MATKRVMGGKMKKGIRERIEDILMLFRGSWGQYDDEDDDDRDPWEDDPRYKKGWKITIPDEDSNGTN